MSAEEISAAAPASRRRFSPRRMLMFVVPVLLALGGGYFWLMAGRYASTDNAYVQRDMVAIVAEVAGRITDVAVTENEPVKRGDLLFRIDPEAYRIALQQADAAISAARMQVEQMRAAYNSAEAEQKSAQDNADYAQKVFDRYQALVKTGTRPGRSSTKRSGIFTPRGRASSRPGRRWRARAPR